MRPESLSAFDQWSERCLLDFEAQKDLGKRVIGIYCTFAPTELVYAAGAIPVGLCGKKEKPIPDAEKVLPANLCPLIKSSYGYAATNTCPYFAFSDSLIGETTCDGKVKMYELLTRIKPVYLMNLPRSCGENDRKYWAEEVRGLARFLEQETGSRIETEELRRQIRLHNDMRRALKTLAYLSADDPVPISALDMMLVQETKSFAVHLQSYTDAVERLVQELRDIKGRKSASDGNGPRILLTGCPIGKGSEKVLKLLQTSGSRVVCQENCTGFKSFDMLVDEDEPDPFLALADRYLKIPCSCMTPNSGRMELLGRLIEDFRIQGIVDLTWQCCHTYNVESHLVKEFAANRYGLPVLHIETDYSESDTEQLRTRIEAFLEIM